MLNAEEKVFKVSFPRTDVNVSVDGWTMKPFMGLTSWAAFTKYTGTHALVMGDLVVFEDEVNPVMSAALDNGLEVTALHNHFFFDQPNVYFMHIGGHGSVESLAKAVQITPDKVKEIRASSSEPKKGFRGLRFLQKAQSMERPSISCLAIPDKPGQDVQGRHWPQSQAWWNRGRQGDGDQHLGRLCREQ